MTTLKAWLKRHGLERHLDAFVENGIDLDVVSEIDAEDLKELGLNLGDRKRFSRAASATKLSPASDISLQLKPALAQPPLGTRQVAVPPPLPVGKTAERRQLSVMFCDMVGSTALSEDMDPEDYREVVSAFQSVATVTMQTNDGFVARYMGDGLLVYFGYPNAREDDAERSVRAGLALAEAVASLTVGVPVSVRVGIATGSVVVGDLIGEGASAEAAVLGETPNLAARLQSVATPGTVVLSEATSRLLGPAFELETLEPLTLKGFTGSVSAHRAVRVLTATEVNAVRVDLHPLVGREVELAMLERAWTRACSAEGQAILIRGEAGVGKSRLLRAFEHRMSARDYELQRWNCSPYHRTTASHPFVEQLRSSLGGGSGNAQHNALSPWLRSWGLDADRYRGALSTLLGVSPEGEVSLPPEAVKHQSIDVQLQWVRAQAHRNPLLFIVEDVHWSDGMTKEMLAALSEDLPESRVLLVLTARPEFELEWAGMSTYELDGLSRSESNTLVRGLLDGSSFSDEEVEAIVARTGGLPLFVEALTQEALAGAGEDSVPSSLQDALTARLDRLGGIKEVAQAASVIGREFTAALLTRILDVRGDEVSDALTTLETADLIRPRRLSSEGAYEFTHALVRDVAYEMLLRDQRRKLHKSIASALAEQATSEPAGGVPAQLIARHYAEAAEPALALPWLVDAVRRANAAGAFEDTLDLCDDGVVLLGDDGLVGLPDLTQWDVEIKYTRALALVWSIGPATSESIDALDAARAVAEAAGDEITSQLSRRWLGQALTHAGDIDGALAHAESIRARADMRGDLAGLALGAAQASWTLINCQEPKRAYAFVPKLLTYFNRLQQAGAPPVDERINVELARGLLVCSQLAVLLGDFDDGWHQFQSCTNRFKGLGDATVDAQKLHVEGNNHLVSHDFEAAVTAHESLWNEASSVGMRYWILATGPMYGSALCGAGRADEAISLLRQTVEYAHKTPTHQARALMYLGQSLAAVEDWKGAHRAFADALTLVANLGARSTWTDAVRVTALWRQNLKHSGLKAAEQELLAARAAATEEGLLPHALEVTMGLAQLWFEHGWTERAQNVLDDTLTHFTQGFTTPLLSKAQALRAAGPGGEL